MSKRSTDLVRYVKFLTNAGVMKEPLWLQAVEKMPPPPPPKPGRKPPRISFPEDRLLDAYFAKHPEAKLEPVWVNGFEPPTARRFVNRQMELMEQGWERKAAFKQVEAEFADAQRQLGGAPATGSIVDQVQREEEAHLRRALREYNLRRGHKPAV